MTHDLFPLLTPFFRKPRGTVYYKGYPPYRGDDVQSVIELAKILPRGVRFIPIPPRIPHVGDLRHLLNALLSEALRSARRARSAKSPAAGSGPDVAPDDGRAARGGHPGFEALVSPRGGSPRQWPPPVRDVPDETYGPDVCRLEQEIGQSVRELVKESLPSELRSQAAKVLEEIRDEPLYAALREIVSATIYGGVDDLSFAPIVPDEGPVLVIGRPELFHHDVPLESLKSPYSLANILKDAGHPNRFDFLNESDDVRFNTRGIRDRKSNIQYLRDERFKDDVGFVFLNRLADGRTVIVAAGTTAFGTYSAVKLLTENRPAFAAAMGRHQEMRGPAAIDIALRCWHHRATEPMLFPFAQDSQHLTIVPLNANDTVGFRWNRRSHELFRPLLDWWSPNEPLEGQAEGCSGSVGEVKWSWDPRPASAPEKGDRVLVNVQVEAPAYQAGRNLTIICGERMGRTLAALKQQVTDDLKDWQSRVRRHLSDPGPHDTFRPVLLVGETGTGKTVIAEAFSEIWPGTTLDDVRHSWESKRGRNQNALLDAAKKAINAKLEAWPEVGQTRAQRIITFCVSAFPVTMLEKELFGCASGYTNDTAAACGVFLQSGTGILFLDELFELPSEQLTRLLVALQKGSVRPLGAEKDYDFHGRLIAATNRAESIQDLDNQAALGQLNPAIVARFKQRYEILPLRERPEEILPQLLHFIQMRIARDISPARGGAKPKEVCVRISRPALDTLLGHDFPENVRELERFVNSLPRDLLASFCARWVPDASADRAELARNASAIRLCHLNVLKPVALGADESLVPGEARGMDEDEFYQITLKLHLRDLMPSHKEWCDELSGEAEPRPRQAPAPKRAASSPEERESDDFETADTEACELDSGDPELRLDEEHPVGGPVPTATQRVRVPAATRLLTSERPEFAQALASLRQSAEGSWVDRLFGTSESNPEADFRLFDAVAERLFHFRNLDELPALFEDEAFSKRLKEACDQILTRLAAMSDEPFDVGFLKPLQEDPDWRVVRRRLPFARLIVALEKALSHPDYDEACRQKRSELRAAHRTLNAAFRKWRKLNNGKGSVLVLLSILLGENFSHLH